MGRAFVASGPVTGREQVDIPQSWVRGVAFPRDDTPQTDRAGTVSYFGNPLFILPAEHRPVHDLIVACRGTLGLQLKRLVRARPDASEKALRFVCALRTISVLGHLHGDHGSTRRIIRGPTAVPDRSDPESRQRVRAAAETLQNRLNGLRDLFEDPMRYTHSPLLRGMENTATALLRVLGSAETRDAIANFADDPAIGPQIKHTYARLIIGSVSHAIQDLSETVRFASGSGGNLRRGAGGLAFDGLVVGQGVIARIARQHARLRAESRSERQEELTNVRFRQALQEAREDDDGGVVGVAVAMSGIFANAFGNVGYGDALMMGIAKSAVIRVTSDRTLRGNPRVLSARTLNRLEHAMLADIPNAEARETIRNALQNPHLGGRDSALEALGNHFQTRPALNVAVTACATMQLAYVIASATSDGQVTADERLDLAEAGIGAATSIYSLASRHVFTVSQMNTAFQNLDRLISALERPVNGFFAVIAIAKGYSDLMEAYEANDARSMAVAGFAMASGVAAAAGAFLSVPYAQPVGVVLGIIAAAIGTAGYAYDATRPPLGKEFLFLARIIERSHHLHNELIDRPELAGVKSAYEALIADIDYDEFKLVFSDPESYRAATRILHDIGYPHRLSGSRQDANTTYAQDLAIDPSGR